MVKKTTTPPGDDEHFASAVRTSAQQIWEAGLGAFAKAQEEGSRVFSRLVSEGHELQQRHADEQVADAAAASFEEQVRRVVAAMDVPARQDIEALQRRVEELSAAVAALSAAPAPAPKKALRARSAPAKPAAVKSAVVKPAVAKPAPKKPISAKTATAKPTTVRPAARKTVAGKAAL